MAEADWTKLVTGALDTSLVSQGYSTVAAFGPLAGTRVYGFHSLSAAVGVAGLYMGLVNFSPIVDSKGAMISACIRKYVRAGDYSPFLFLATGPSAAAYGYRLGLSTGYPYKIVLDRNLIGAPLKAGLSSNLGESDGTAEDNAWYHLRMTVGVHTHKDVLIEVSFDANDPIVPGAPAWGDVAGIDDVVDDRLGLLSGSPALTGDFYPGIAHYNDGASGRLSLFESFVARRQTTP